MDAASKSLSFNKQSILDFARRTIRQEAESLLVLAANVDSEFQQAIDILDGCAGSVVVTGMGKAGLIGQKISATFCSTGTRSFFLHPAEAIHGDLGRVSQEDVVLALSKSGETEELLRVLPPLAEFGAELVSITSNRNSTLGKASRVVIELGELTEACAIGLAPSTSTTTMLAAGDALALTLSRCRDFTPRDFARIHPGGSLGRKLTKVQEVMRPLEECRIARPEQSVREVFITLRRSGRRTGAVMIVDDGGHLVGLFTDSDLVRLLEQEPESALDRPVHGVMTCRPHSVLVDTLMPKVIEVLAAHHISELPVVTEAGIPRGLIDITDLIGWLPNAPTDEIGDESDDWDNTMTLPFPGGAHRKETT